MPKSQKTERIDQPQEGATGTSRVRRLVAPLSGALLVAALVAAGWFGYGWVHALASDKPQADAREAAFSAARQAAVNLTSFDSRNVETTLDNYESSVTGELEDDLRKNRTLLLQKLGSTGAKAEGTVIGGALTALDRSEGIATALIFIDTTNTTTAPAVALAGQPVAAAPASVLQRYAFSVELKKVDDEWRAATMNALPEGAASTPVNAGPDSSTTTPAPAPDAQSPAPDPSAPGADGGP